MADFTATLECGITKILILPFDLANAEWICPTRLHISSMHHQLASGWYDCRVPPDGSPPSCHLDFWYHYELGLLHIPSILIPVAIVMSYVLWCQTMRKEVLAQFSENETEVQGKDEERINDAKTLSRDSQNVDSAKSVAEKIILVDERTDAEAQMKSPLAPSRVFKYSKPALQVWFMSYAVTQILYPGRLEQFPPLQVLASLYTQHVAALLLDGLIFHPKWFRGTVMVSCAWLLVFLRDTVDRSMLSMTGLQPILAMGALVVVYFLVPLPMSPENNSSHILLFSAACLVIRVISPLLDPTTFPRKGDEGTPWGFLAFNSLAPGLSIMGVWSAIHDFKQHGNLPLTMRMSGIIGHSLFEFITGAVYGAMIGLAMVALLYGFGAVVSYFTSCIGIQRLVFGVTPVVPDPRDWTGLIGASIWSLTMTLPMLRDMDITPTTPFRRVGVSALEAVAKTLGGLLLLALPLILSEIWDGKQNMIYPQPVWLKRMDGPTAQ